MNEDSLEHLVVELAAQARSRFWGKYRGIVQDVDDPEGLARLRAYVPEVLDTEVSPWALPCVPYAGPDQGLHAVPPVGAGVWIEFEAGDPARPVWVGAWWSRDEPPANEQGSAPRPPHKTLKSASGLMLALDDDAHTATLSDARGNNLVTLQVDQGQVKVVAATKVIVEAPQIELVENAQHPLAFGDNLLQYLNQLVQVFSTHTHVGETVLGIPVTPMIPSQPFPPATPSLLSTRVKTG
ncbi:phage baseplate assembly protein V [Azohydromonas caseinilytica]|uniref:phage baseplate assembly protein V n=1 Tax=Azohydromonas caseinilytica TaxID=2728836 RepID=UPI00197B85DB|nr:phage baseplate assembly protein V [Azohydromonas caseinilytica]